MSEPLIRSRRLLPARKCAHEELIQKLENRLKVLEATNAELQRYKPKRGRARLDKDVTTEAMKYQVEGKLGELEYKYNKLRTETMDQRRTITRLKHDVQEWKDKYYMKGKVRLGASPYGEEELDDIE